MNKRTQLFNSAGWKAMPKELQAEAERRLFKAKVDEDLLR